VYRDARRSAPEENQHQLTSLLKMDTYGTFCEGSAWMLIAGILFLFFSITVCLRVRPGIAVISTICFLPAQTKMPSEETKVSFIEFNGADMALS
jgi:hypothetical protein